MRAQPDRLPAGRILAPAAWMLLIYGLTVLAEGGPPPPEAFWARLAFEVRHVLAHGFVYAVQAVLLARLAAPPAVNGRGRTIVLAAAVALGVGQEVLQSLLRGRVTPGGSLLDLTVDLGGAALGLRLFVRGSHPSQER